MLRVSFNIVLAAIKQNFKMKLIITSILAMTLLANCGVSSRSVVDREAIKEPYKNPLIVIPYDKGAVQKFSLKLKENIENDFMKDSKKVEVILFESPKKELELNTNNEIDDKINSSVQSNNKDLVIIFKPTNYSYYNGSLESATYEIVAMDAKTRKEVWKCKLTTKVTIVGLSTMGQKSAKVFYDKVTAEGVL